MSEVRHRLGEVAGKCRKASRGIEDDEAGPEGSSHQRYVPVPRFGLRRR